MRMSPTDKLHAIKRHPEYIKDHKELLQIQDLNDSDSILAAEDVIKAKWWGFSVFQIERAEEIRAKGKRPLSCVWQVNRIDDEPLIKFQSSHGKSQKEWTRGDSLYLKIDPTASKKDLLRDFKQIIDKLPGRSKQEGRERQIQEDPWDVYDKNKAGLSIWKITKLLHGVAVRPADSEDSNVYRTRVNTALGKAKRMINEVTPTRIPIPFPGVF